MNCLHQLNLINQSEHNAIALFDQSEPNTIDNELFQAQAKFSPERAKACVTWIEEVTGSKLGEIKDQIDFAEHLKDGSVLCNLINCLQPGKRTNQKIALLISTNQEAVFLLSTNDNTVS